MAVRLRSKDKWAARDAAIMLLKRGEATMGEIAMLSGISRQGVRKWARRAGIDPVATRVSYLCKLWSRHYEQASGRE